MEKQSKKSSLKSNYRSLVMFCHPDRNKYIQELSEELFKVLSNHFERAVIGDFEASLKIDNAAVMLSGLGQELNKEKTEELMLKLYVLFTGREFEVKLSNQEILLKVKKNFEDLISLLQLIADISLADELTQKVMNKVFEVVCLLNDSLQLAEYDDLNTFNKVICDFAQKILEIHNELLAKSNNLDQLKNVAYCKEFFEKCNLILNRTKKPVFLMINTKLNLYIVELNDFEIEINSRNKYSRLEGDFWWNKLEDSREKGRASSNKEWYQKESKETFSDCEVFEINWGGVKRYFVLPKGTECITGHASYRFVKNGKYERAREITAYEASNYRLTEVVHFDLQGRLGAQFKPYQE